MTQVISTSILPVLLIQEDQLSFNGEENFAPRTGNQPLRSLFRNNIDYYNMASAYYCGHKALNQTNKIKSICSPKELKYTHPSLTRISLVSFLSDIVPDVTPQNAASHQGLFCLLREFSSKN